jgi:YfiH family protein
VTAAQRRDGAAVTIIAEELVSTNPPRFELAAWRRDLGLTAGITGRGSEPGRGFDLGLWSEAPVGGVMGRWQRFRRSVPGFPGVALGHQVHGVEVMTVGPSRGWLQVEGIDGWVTAAPGVLLTVTIADCIPVYLSVPGKGVALLHAGWRGTAAGILARGAERLIQATGADWADIVMHCGVGICGSCYEVGSEVIAGCGLSADGGGPWHLDLRETLAEQAARIGIRQVTRSPHCSAHDRPTFYSHRASRGADGRMAAYLGIPIDSSALSD